jgi:ABC-type polysaccharide/polyol phosphate export permease
MALPAAPPSSLVRSSVSEEWLSADIPSPSRLALRDLAAGLDHWHLWARLSWEDIRQRYRRSFLGPFWISLSMLVMVASLGTLYSKILHQDMREYLPFLALGLLYWQLLSDILRDGCVTFLSQEGLIRQIRLPLSSHAYRVIYRQFLVLGHNIVIYIPIALIFRIWPGWLFVLELGGLMLWVINSVWVCMLLGMMSARFRDVPPLVAAIVQIVFFMSPILWQPATLGTREGAVEFNPVYHFLEIVRAPLLGHMPDPRSWIAVGLITLVGWGVTFPFFARFRARIAYWL